MPKILVLLWLSTSSPSSCGCLPPESFAQLRNTTLCYGMSKITEGYCQWEYWYSTIILKWRVFKVHNFSSMLMLTTQPYVQHQALLTSRWKPPYLLRFHEQCQVPSRTTFWWPTNNADSYQNPRIFVLATSWAIYHTDMNSQAQRGYKGTKLLIWWPKMLQLMKYILGNL
jgi:hypothetical protein